ncbi:MAG: SNF2-related protein, partial [Actinomycetales bacterium]
FIDTPAEVVFDIVRSAKGLVATPELWVDEEPVPYPQLEFIGRPAQAAFAWLASGPSGKPEELVLMALASAITDDLGDLLRTEASIQIPAQEEAEFLREGYPALARQFRICSQDGSFTPPEPARPNLHLTVCHHPVPANAPWDRQVLGPGIELQWNWSYELAGEPDTRGGQVVPLRTGAGADGIFRDLDQEDRILAELDWLLEQHPDLVAPGQSHLAARSTLYAGAMLDFLERDLERLRRLDDLRVVDDGTSYLEATGDPQIAVHLEQRPQSWDWFDLQVEVTIGGEQVPFELLFRALATDAELLFLPSGRYLRLDAEDPERVERLQRLRSLIEEARELRESARDPLGISRYQVDLWEELVELGVVDEQSASWQRAIARLPLAQAHQPEPLPPGAIQAEPRPYQYDGFAWLSFLRTNGLGGILADDMGLGKTL